MKLNPSATNSKRTKLTLDDFSHWAVGYTYELERGVPTRTKVRLMKDFIKRYKPTDMLMGYVDDDGGYGTFKLKGIDTDGKEVTLGIPITRRSDERNKEEFYAIELAYFNIPKPLR